MRWHALKLKMGRTDLGARIWKLLWEASIAGERADEGNALFLADAGADLVTLYFPPPAHLLATAVGAAGCAKPDPAQLTLLAGPQSAWRVHFGPGDTVPVQLDAMALPRYAA